MNTHLFGNGLHKVSFLLFAFALLPFEAFALPLRPGISACTSSVDDATKIEACAGVTGDDFGEVVVADEYVMVAGMPGDDEKGSSIGLDDSGAAMVYRFDGNDWIEEAKLMAPFDPKERSENFGAALALDGDVLIVGEPGDHQPSSSQAGAVHVFRYDSTLGWQHEAELFGDTSTTGTVSRFGTTLAYENGVLMVGAPLENTLAENSGAVYVFEDQGNGVWQQVQKLVPSELTEDDQFGLSMTMKGKHLLIGSLDDENKSNQATNEDEGALYHYMYDGSQWVLNQKVTPTVRRAGELFGAAVDMNDWYLTVGAPGARAKNKPEGGMAYIYTFSAGEWVVKETLEREIVLPQDRFGSTIFMGGGNILVGTDRDAGHMNEVDMFRIEQRNITINLGKRVHWPLIQTIQPSDLTGTNHLGTSIALGEDMLFVGAPGGTGGVYMYPLDYDPIYVRIAYAIPGPGTYERKIKVFDSGKLNFSYRAGGHYQGGTGPVIDSEEGIIAFSPAQDSFLDVMTYFACDEHQNCVPGGAAVYFHIAKNFPWTVYGQNSIKVGSKAELQGGAFGSLLNSEKKTLGATGVEVDFGSKLVIPVASSLQNQLEVFPVAPTISVGKDTYFRQLTFYEEIVGRARISSAGGLPLPIDPILPDMELLPFAGNSSAQDVLIGRTNHPSCQTPHMICLESGETLSPGAYGTLEIFKGKKTAPIVALFGGGADDMDVYFFESVEIGNFTDVQFTEPTTFVVEKALEIKKGVQITPSSGTAMTAGDIIFQVHGDQVKPTKHVKIGNGGLFQAHVKAPNGRITFGRGHLKGALYGEDVMVKGKAFLEREN